jgi:hypothetical protein
MSKRNEALAATTVRGSWINEVHVDAQAFKPSEAARGQGTTNFSPFKRLDMLPVNAPYLSSSLGPRGRPLPLLPLTRIRMGSPIPQAQTA